MIPSIKGQNVKQVKEYLLKTFGQEAITKVLEVLSPEDRAAMGKAYTSFWEPELSFVHFLEATEKVFGKGDYSVVFQSGYYSANEGIPKFFKLFIRLGDPLFVIKRSAAIWGLTHNHGTLEVERLSAKSAIAHLVDYQTPSRAFCASLRGYCTAVLEISGAKNVSVVEKQCVCDGAGYCEFEASWE